MFSTRSLAEYSIISALFLAVFLVSFFLVDSIVLGIGLFSFLIIYYGMQIGDVFPHKNRTLKHLSGILSLIAAISVIGSLAYYMHKISPLFIAGLITITPFLIFLIKHTTKQKITRKNLQIQQLLDKLVSSTLFLLIQSFLTILIFAVLVGNQVTTSIRSPWLALPEILFLLFFLSAGLFAASLFSRSHRNASLISFLLILAPILLIAAVLYPLGYGFDPFIHMAAIEHIAEFGTITPKTLYYIGEYALVITLHHGFHLPTELISQYLVPIFAIITLPISLFINLKAIVKKGSPIAGLVAIFFIPLSSFVATTPQGLSNIWSLLVIFSTIPIVFLEHKPHQFIFPIIAAIAAVFTHPLAGIPVVLYLIFLGLNSLLQSNAPTKFIKIALNTLFFLIASVSIPVIFLVNAFLSGLPTEFRPGDLLSVPLLNLLGLQGYIGNRFDSFLDAAYLFGENRIILILFFVILGFIVLRKISSKKTLYYVPALFSAILAINYLLLSGAIEFSFLIDYERNNYADRLFELAIFFFIPYIAIIFMKWHGVLNKQVPWVRLVSIILVAAIVSAAAYMTYPRHDRYNISRGFNIGESDIRAVEYIHNANTHIDYIVLANQAVSAAAVHEYGFLHYFNDIFYYPIPTGGALYEIYLDLVNDVPSQTKIEEAMDLAGVNRAYFVLNTYWFNADQIIENAQSHADDWVIIGENDVYIFEYIR